MRKLTFLFKFFSKFRENLIDQWKPNPQYLQKIFSGKHFKTFAYKLITVCIFDGVAADFKKIIIWREVTSITKSRKFSRIFGQIWNPAQKMKFFMKDFFCKHDQIHWKLRIRSRLLKKSLMENLIFCAVKYLMIASYNWWKFLTVILRKSYVTMTLCKNYLTVEILWMCFNENL